MLSNESYKLKVNRKWNAEASLIWPVGLDNTHSLSVIQDPSLCPHRRDFFFARRLDFFFVFSCGGKNNETKNSAFLFLFSLSSFSSFQIIYYYFDYVDYDVPCKLITLARSISRLYFSLFSSLLPWFGEGHLSALYDDRYGLAFSSIWLEGTPIACLATSY